MNWSVAQEIWKQYRDQTLHGAVVFVVIFVGAHGLRRLGVPDVYALVVPTVVATGGYFYREGTQRPSRTRPWDPWLDAVFGLLGIAAGVLTVTGWAPL